MRRKEAKPSFPDGVLGTARLLCRPALREEIEGDLLERFERLVRSHGDFRARIIIWFEMAQFIRPRFMGRRPGSPASWPGLLASYLTISFRSIRRQRMYAFVNLLGLSVGMACFLIIGRFVSVEMSFDRFFEDADRIFRIVQQQPGNEYLGRDTFGVTPVPLANALVDDYPEVESSTTLTTEGGLLSTDDETFYESGLRATASVFDVFSYSFEAGNPTIALADPHAIVLTATLADKLFPGGDAIGRIVRLGENDEFTVTGILKDPPTNSHLSFSYIASIASESNYARNPDNWDNSSWYTYFKLKPGHSGDAFAGRLDALVEKHTEPEDDPQERRRYIAQSLTDIHLRSNVNFEISPNGDIRKVYLFGAIGIVILLLACMNYMNLAVARSVQRSREVGMRKVVGARRAQLVLQFLGESTLYSALAFLAAIGIVAALLTPIGTFVERDLALGLGELVRAAVPLGGVVLAVGLASGSYPALFISRIRPSAILKNGGLSRSGRTTGRRLLVTAQIAVSVVLMVGSLVILKQLRYIQRSDPGYAREQIITTSLRDVPYGRLAALRGELMSRSGILNVATSSHLPTNISSATEAEGVDETGESDAQRIYQASVSQEFFNVFDIDLLEGRALSDSFPGDSAGAVVLNETAMRVFGWDTIEGKSLNYGGNQHRKVVGLVRDFHLHSLHRPIEPLMLTPGSGWTNHVSARIASADVEATVEAFRNAVSEFTDYPVQVNFLDEIYSRMYRTETRLGEMLVAFTMLALLIGALGLFGLAAFSAEQRRREIGIRKALGATTGSIVRLMSRELVALIGIATGVGAPIAYLFASNWLNGFSYRVTIDPGVYLLTIVFVSAVAWLAISYQAIRAARMDPAETLRSE